MLTTLIACDKSTNTTDNTNIREYPSLPVYIQPGNNTSIIYQQYGMRVIFKWNACSDPQGDPLTYDLVVGGAESHTVLSLTSPEDSLSFHTFGDYTWYVIARDNHGNYTQGPTWKFTPFVKKSSNVE